MGGQCRHPSLPPFAAYGLLPCSLALMHPYPPAASAVVSEVGMNIMDVIQTYSDML